MSSRSDSVDPFPREEAVELVKRLPAYARLALAVARDDALPGRRRAALLGAGTYVVSPIGLVPGFIPLLGQLDDLWLLLRALRFALDGLSPQSRAEHLTAAGLTEAAMDADYASVGELLSWTARRGRFAAIRAAAGGRVLGRRISERATRLSRDLARRIERSGSSDREPSEPPADG